VPEENYGLMALHIEITNGSRQICSEAKKWTFMAKHQWSITRTDSLMWLNMCGMKSFEIFWQ